MSDPFEVQFEWLDGTGIRDEALARTFARLEIRIGETTVTRAFDRHRQTVTNATCVSLLPLAAWAADALWVACCESPRAREVRSARNARGERERAWARRHGWLPSREGMALPEVIFSRVDDAKVRVDWIKEPDTFAPMPLMFLKSGRAVVARDAVMGELLRLLEATVAQCEGITTAPVAALRSRWELLSSACAQERLVCERAARIGLDAYDPEEVDDELAELLGGQVSVGEATLGDLLDVVEEPRIDRLSEQLAKLDDLVAEARDSTGRGAPPPALSTARRMSRVTTGLPHERGYARARALRSGLLDLQGAVVGEGLDEMIQESLLPREAVRESNEPFLFHGIQAFAAAAQEVPLVVIRQRSRAPQRFERARALHALITSDAPRLVTAAFDADQQASRAFAAELLVPAEHLRSRLTSRYVDAEDLNELAREYIVDPQVIRHQIENHEIAELVDA